MNSITVSAIVFACVFGGSLLGVLLRASLPKDNLSPESRDVVKLAMRTIVTMTAVVLGLLVASAKGYYDNQNRELMEMSARVVLLDRILAHYGPEAKDARDELRRTVARLLDRIWTQPLHPFPRRRLRRQASLLLTRFRNCRRRPTPNALFKPGPSSNLAATLPPPVRVQRCNSAPGRRTPHLGCTRFDKTQLSVAHACNPFSRTCKDPSHE